MNNEKYEKRKVFLNKTYNEKLEKIEKLKKDLEESKNNNDIRRIEFYERQISNVLDTMAALKSKIDYMRPDTEEDLNERTEIRKNYPTLINEVIPDGVPVVFHGNNNIGMVKKIINDGGLLSPLERNVDFKSFASLIDVTYKSNIRVSCEFADDNVNSFTPYGAIFVFYPKEEEYENVLKTGSNSEVSGGVESIHFNEDRFIGVITTNENLDEIRECLKQNGIDPNKAFNHSEFIEYCKKTFNENKKMN